MICERCNADIYPPPNRPDWKRCIQCTFGGGAHASRKRFGPAPAMPLPVATDRQVTFVIPGPPLSVNKVYRMGFNKNGRRVMYFNKTGLQYKHSIVCHAAAAISKVAWPLDRRYAITLVEYFDNPRADSDNPIKVVRDALEGILYTNDSQIVSDHTEKLIDRIAPRLVVTVEVVE